MKSITSWIRARPKWSNCTFTSPTRTRQPIDHTDSNIKFQRVIDLITLDPLTRESSTTIVSTFTNCRPDAITPSLLTAFFSALPSAVTDLDCPRDRDVPYKVSDR